jgi:hypothetical protein
MTLFLLLIIAAIVLGLIGAVASGLMYLLVIGVVVFVLDLAYGFWRMRHRPVR